MNDLDMVFVQTVKDKPGFCEVFYNDGTSNIIEQSIGDIKHKLDNTSRKLPVNFVFDEGDIKHKLDTTGRRHYCRLTRSAFVCLNNIVMVSPSQRKLVIAFDFLDKKHMELSFSDDVLRLLREALSNKQCDIRFLDRILQFENSEIIYRFCPEEILYMEAEKGKERTNVYLLNGTQYCIPIGVGKVAKKIDTELSIYRGKKKMGQIGRSLIINIEYLSTEIRKNEIRLVADLGGKPIEKTLRISVSECRKLSQKLMELQKNNQKPDFDLGDKWIFCNHHRHIKSDIASFFLKLEEIENRPDEYYDIDDDQINFLGE